MAARVTGQKPNTKVTQVYKDLNARIRRMCDMVNWSALIARGVINVPGAYTTGVVTLTTNSTVVTGTGTAWPVNDVVNTAMTNGVRAIGYQEITPASMTGIGVDVNLYVNDGTFSEVVPVVEITNSTFIGQFKYQHNPGTAITSSSLAGLQLQIGGYQPVYTLLAVTSATTGIIDMPFAGAPLTGVGYQLLKAYVTIDPNLKDILGVWDPIQGIDLSFHIGQEFLAAADPQRTATRSPQALVDLSPSASGCMQWELWPYQTTPYALPVLYVKHWPELRRPTDKPPWFINP